MGKGRNSTPHNPTCHGKMDFRIKKRRRRKLVAEERRREKRVKIGYLSLFVDGEEWKWNARLEYVKERVNRVTRNSPKN